MIEITVKLMIEFILLRYWDLDITGRVTNVLRCSIKACMCVCNLVHCWWWCWTSSEGSGSRSGLQRWHGANTSSTAGASRGLSSEVKTLLSVLLPPEQEPSLECSPASRVRCCLTKVIMFPIFSIHCNAPNTNAGLFSISHIIADIKNS